MLEVVVGSPLAAIQPPLSWWGLCLAVLLIVIRLDVVVSLFQGHIASIVTLAIQVSAVLVLAGALGPVWWHYWMYYGWAGPPSWFTSFLATADSGAGWNTHKEMVISLCTLFTALVISMNIATVMQTKSARARR